MNKFDITILEDGTVRIDTGEFKGAVQLAADKALQWIQEQMGGEVTRERLKHGHHHHNHNHDHKLKA